MAPHRDDDPSFSDAHLESPEYRDRLMRKLNCLIAVLEVACSKVRRSLSGPAPDVDRLMRIHKNLRETLEVCLRARNALERREDFPDGLPENLAGAMEADHLEHATEISDALAAADMADPFAERTPIDAAEIGQVDWEDLERRLQG